MASPSTPGAQASDIVFDPNENVASPALIAARERVRKASNKLMSFVETTFEHAEKDASRVSRVLDMKDSLRVITAGFDAGDSVQVVYDAWLDHARHLLLLRDSESSCKRQKK